MRAFNVALTSGLFLAAVVGAVPGPGPVTGNIAVHDPTMCKDKNGKYWLFATGKGIPIRSSATRVDFKLEGAVWPNGAPWTDRYTPANARSELWAPDCYYSGGTFHLFYAASGFGIWYLLRDIYNWTTWQGRLLCPKELELTIVYLTGSFTDKGLVLESTANDNFNAIDPNLLVVGNTWYLSFGSFWTGIKSVQLDPGTGRTKGAIKPIAQRPNAGGAVEASTVYKYGSYYYLFTSWDACCKGTSSTYNIRVGRSNRRIVGPGGQDIFDDGDGPILVYHYYTSSGSLLGINRLDFKSGWPVVV
ncbi:arabinan endo--alpha-l-arabinosidase [Moniliophthora roreri]|uniref:Endo-1,5-alpha-L-arabinanase A n=1 Tax=Moniliophthora roreri TaxID=221103 RepID=A0A0W0FMK4_MONRR|nr:arabinan endo--alpha-l-arabinosidase [Moniliophthora roreri]